MRQMFLIIIALLLLTACGSDPWYRAGDGAAIGALTGATAGLMFGPAIVPMAIIGGVVGAAAGGFTSSDQVDLSTQGP